MVVVQRGDVGEIGEALVGIAGEVIETTRFFEIKEFIDGLFTGIEARESLGWGTGKDIGFKGIGLRCITTHKAR